MRKKTKNKTIVTLLLLSMLLGGCSGKNDKYEEVDMSLVENQNPASFGDGNVEDSNGDDMSFGEADDIYQNDTSLSFEIHTAYDSTLTISNMEVKNTIGSSPKIYEVNPPELSDYKLRALAEKLFDNGEYDILTPYGVCDMETLKNELEYWNQYSQTESYEDNELWRVEVANHTSNLEFLITGELPSVPSQKEEGQLQVLYNIPAELYQEKGLEVPPTTYSKALLRGYVDGDPWMLEVWNYYPPSAKLADHQIEIYAYNMLKVEGSPFYGETGFVKDATNRDDEAKAALASDTMLSKLGFGNAEKVDTVELARYPVYNPDGNGFVQGYEFTYSMWNENMPTHFLDKGDCYIAENRNYECVEVPNQRCGVPEIEVDTRAGKVESVHITNYMPDRTILSKDVQLIGKEHLLEKLGIYLEQYWTFGKDGSEYALEQDEIYDYLTLTLRYVLIPFTDEHGMPHYNLMPVWVCGFRIPDLDGEEAILFGIQAIDGTCVNFMQRIEMY